jgi:hypothetical protein
MSRKRAVFSLMLLLLWDKGVLGQPGSALADYRWARKSFRPAEFKGIRMGESTSADVRKTFGRPSDSGMGQDGYVYMGYRAIGPIPEYTEFVIDSDTKIVEFMRIQTETLSMSAAEQIFGRAFAKLRFSVRACSPEDEFAFATFDPNGDVEMVVYPELGIVLHIKSPGGNEVYEITYNSRWIEPEKNPCGTGDRNKKPQGQKRKK